MIQVSPPRLVRALLIPLVVLAWLAVLLVVGWLLSHVVRAVLLLVLAALIAFALTPLVNLLARWMPRLLAIAISYVIGFTVIFGVLTLIVVTAAGEVTNFVHHLPVYEHWAQNLQPEVLGLLSPFGVTAAQLRQFEMGAVSALESLGTTAANDALGIVTTVLNTVVDGFLVLILSVYVTASGPRLVRWVREQAPRGQRRRANLIINIFNRVVGGYVRGTLILASMVGVLVGGGMAVLGVRYALLLGILAFFMEFVPVLGVIISGAVCVVLALFQGWVLALIVVAYFAVVHVIEGDLVGPRVMGRAIGIHPAVALLALVAGTDLFGLWGALFGAPIAGLIQAIVVAIWTEVRQTEIVEA
ncbi:MAG: AI-2E family transporter, partial [Candidatus Dormibacteraeota bacterium]|nr:AI-2E family transporter [Candidatus Dormibacteraeota bacterium]